MWKNKDVISILDFSREELEKIFEVTDEILAKDLKVGEPLRGSIVATAFFEPSTRTRLSFESAAKRLGAEVITLAENISSIAKGESLGDTLRMLDDYSDIIIVRSPYEGTAKMGADLCEHPVINGGDGTQHHPTQAMIDLYTIRRLKGSIDGLNIGVVGDLKYGRAAASFIYGVTKFNIRKLWLIYPEQLAPREEIREWLGRCGVKTIDTDNLREALPDLDILYVTRIQKERFPDPSEYEKVKGSYIVNQELLKNSKNGLKVLHPLPRVDELSYDVDDTEYQAYLTQAKFGVPVRMALLSLITGVAT